jgi:hypothetical protein
MRWIWNDKLRSLAAAQEAYEKAKAADASVVTGAERAELMDLATDFPRLWRDPRTQMKEKKRRAGFDNKARKRSRRGLRRRLRFSGLQHLA